MHITQDCSKNAKKILMCKMNLIYQYLLWLHFPRRPVSVVVALFVAIEMPIFSAHKQFFLKSIY